MISKNIEALKYFLSIGVNPSKRCDEFFANIWIHVLELENKSRPLSLSEVAILLMKNGTDINSSTAEDEVPYCIFQLASNRSKRLGTFILCQKC